MVDERYYAGMNPNTPQARDILAKAHQAAAVYIRAHPWADRGEYVSEYVKQYGLLVEDHTDPGHCGCPQCSRERLEAKAAAQGKAMRKLKDRAGPERPKPEPWPAEKRTTRADRDKVADLLSQHFAAGSLDEGEFSERTDAALAAKFPSALAALTTDLPDLPELPAATRRGKPGAPVLQACLRQPRGVQVFLWVMAGLGLLSLLGGDLGGPLAAAVIAVAVLGVRAACRRGQPRYEKGSPADYPRLSPDGMLRKGRRP
jgi:hypothetical protein